MKHTIRDYIKLYQALKPTLKESASETVKLTVIAGIIPAAIVLGLSAIVASTPPTIGQRWTSRTDGECTIVEKIGTFPSPVSIVDYNGDGLADEKIAGRYRVRASEFDQDIFRNVLDEKY